MTGILCSFLGGAGGPPTGQEAYETPGTYTWVAPAGVTSVSVVAVGAGGGGYVNAGGGGGLRYYNNYAVTPGNSYTVTVGARGTDNGSSGGTARLVVF